MKIKLVTVTTMDHSVPSLPVHLSTCAANVTRTTQVFTVSPSPILLSFLNHANPLPTSIKTCINVDKLSNLLSSHPNRHMVDNVVNGLQKGFSIGFNGVHHKTQPKNLLFASKNKELMNEAITKELVRGHTSGPFKLPPFPDLHCSPIGGVIKKDNSCRLILDLSQLSGKSVNEGIMKEDYSVRYTSFDEATDIVRQAGVNCYMCKVDIKHAFRLIPICIADWKLLGYSWQGYFL